MGSNNWLKIYFNKKLITRETENAKLIDIPGMEHQFWITNKLVKFDRESKEYYILYKADFTINIFNTKKVDDKWNKIDEKTVLLSSLVNSFKSYKEVSTSQSKHLIKYTSKTSYKIGFTDSNFNYISFWVPKSFVKKYDSKISICAPIDYKINISIQADEEKNIDYTGQELISYIRNEIDNLHIDKTKTPTLLETNKNISIASELKDSENSYSETSMLRTTTSLYAHQVKAVAKLLPSRYGALFMDMGTGKTRTAIELIKIRQNKISKFIWVTPVSLKHNVSIEIQKHTNLQSNDIYMFDSKTNDKNIPAKLAYIVGIESIGMSDRVFLALDSLIDDDSFIIVDESSFIKGNSKQSKRIIKSTQNTRYRLILTGTPISQGIIDLYNQIRFLSPKIFGYKSFYAFAHYHIRYSSRYENQILSYHNETYLAEMMKPYVYQVAKEECLTLPKKNYINKYFNMSTKQRTYYEEAKEELLFQVDISDFNATNIFRLFTRLQQIISGFFKDDNGEISQISNDRLDFLKDIIEEIDKDEKIIIWSKFIYDVKMISSLIQTLYGDESFVIYTGQQSEHEKSEAYNKFKNNIGTRFFIATQSSGAYGLTLTESSHVIFYNNTFKYSQRIQAEDRIHRIGQTRISNYINISCSNSIDIKIDNSIFEKANIVSDFKQEMEMIKDKKLKKALLSAIMDGNLELAEKIKLEDKKKNNTAAKRMEKMRRKRGVQKREEYLSNSLSQKRPWEDQGISRATWYRREQKERALKAIF